MNKLAKNEKVAFSVAFAVFVLFLCVSVLAGVLFGIVGNLERDFSDYRSEAEFLLSELEKEKNQAGVMVDTLNKQLALAEKNRLELERQISQTEAEIKQLEASFENKDELYKSLNSQLTDLKASLDEKLVEIAALKKDIEEYEKTYGVDLNLQASLIRQLEALLTEGAPMNTVVSAICDENGNPMLDGEGHPLQSISYVYPKISLYYEDLSRGYRYVWNGDSVFSSGDFVHIPMALSVLQAASKEQADYDEKLAEYIAQNGVTDTLPNYTFRYDLTKIFTYTEDKYQSGFGVIKNEEYGMQYTHKELFRALLQHSDCIAYTELRAEYGTSLMNGLLGQLGANVMRKNNAQTTAREMGSLMKETYRFLESEATYAPFMKEGMLSSVHSVMIGYGVSPKKIAHKNAWVNDAYHDMAIVYDENPYVLVIMSDMDAGGDEVNTYVQRVADVIDQLHENFHP